MKMTQKMILMLGLVCSTVLPQSLEVIPRIACDIDGVVLHLPKSQWPVIAYKAINLIRSGQDMIDLPKTLWCMYKSFTQKTGGARGLHDAQGNKIDGLTAQMLTIGMRHKEATRFIAPILGIIETSRQLDKNVIKIIQNTNLPIVWTTNKDSLTYQRAVQVHGLDTIATKAIVTYQPLSKDVLEFAQRADTPENYRTLAEKYHNDQKTDTIIHAPGQKPDLEYFEHVEKIIGPEKHIIFIDDKKKNVAGFNKLSNSSTAQRIGIHYTGNPDQLATQLKLACGSIRLGQQPARS